MFAFATLALTLVAPSIRVERRGGEERALISALGDDGRAIGSCTVAVRALGGRCRPSLEEEASALAAPRPLLLDVFVSKRERRRGVGKALIRESEAIARGWGYDALSLEVLAANTRARSFYEDQGYRVVAAQALPERARPKGVRQADAGVVRMRKQFGLLSKLRDRLGTA